MKRVFYVAIVLLSMVLFSNMNYASIFNYNSIITLGNDKEAYEEDIHELCKGDLPKTRSLVKYIEVWNHRTYLEISLNANIGIVTVVLSDTNGNIINSNILDSSTQPIVDINIPLTQEIYLLYITSSTGYQAYATVNKE